MTKMNATTTMAPLLVRGIFPTMYDNDAAIFSHQLPTLTPPACFHLQPPQLPIFNPIHSFSPILTPHPPIFNPF